MYGNRDFNFIHVGTNIYTVVHVLGQSQGFLNQCPVTALPLGCRFELACVYTQHAPFPTSMLVHRLLIGNVDQSD